MCVLGIMCVCFACVVDERNSLGVDRLFLHNSSKFFPVVKELYDRPADEVVRTTVTYRTCIYLHLWDIAYL